MITNNKVFIVVQHILLAFLVVMAIVPFWLLISSSFTTERELLEHGYSLFPKVVTLDAYRYLFSVSGGVLRAYMMSIIIAGSGVFTCLFPVLHHVVQWRVGANLYGLYAIVPYKGHHICHDRSRIADESLQRHHGADLYYLQCGQ